MHDIRSMNRSNPNCFRPRPSYKYHHSIHSPSYFLPQRMNQPETQAQLVAFTPPLMSIRLPYSEFQTYEQNDCPSRSYIFASNFSDKPSSNSNNKTKIKHVTLQEPNMANELVNTNSNHMTYPLSSSNWTLPTHMHPSSRPSNRHYNPYNYQYYNQFRSQSEMFIAALPL
ncbi:unnamed protein product [Rotaria sordida]|uniref:Uncharacterized protein n=1 Tax=Rotaria sordida TaxID=392033 RepID=A0A814ATV0_9BILA|nr:unnamed protein product [Rotaria sordida]CAF1011381.1 unnamed protein product [Rotaria sordida]CAF1226189.1 unnamed protein product [Rotaria sordida]